MTAILIGAVTLLVVGTLIAGLGTLTRQPRHRLITAGRVFWCAAGSLAGTGAALTACALLTGNSADRAALHLIGELSVTMAALVLVHLFGGLLGGRRRGTDPYQDNDRELHLR